ncbi:MAG: PAS domain-containing protein [Sedimentisphaerales bacterium]|nr:PAS domain-containing protein [Sedimentisphaerales bacterium]
MSQPKSKTKAAKTTKKAFESLRFGHIAQKLIHNMPLGVVVFDKNLRITDTNPYAAELLGPCVNIATALTDGCGPNSDFRWDDALKKVLQSGHSATYSSVLYSLNSRNLTLHIICDPLTDEISEKIIGGILLIEDTTAKTAMQSDLADAERLAAVGKLAARVAHELNNPLDGIIRYLNLALRVVDQHDIDQVGNYLSESQKGLQRMVQIISELLEFSRSTYSSFQQADINKIVEEAVKAMEILSLDNHVVVTRNYSKLMPNIRSGNLFQVFCNLVKNAIDAMPDGGELIVSTRCNEHHALIEFADTGTGIPDDVIDKLFEPFFTTKAPGKGTGLGLAICKDIIERYNGNIEAKNLPRGGTLFTVSIPLERTTGLSEKDND